MSLYVNPMASSYAVRNDTGDIEALKRKVAFKELEQIFVSMLVQEMRKSVPEGGMLTGGPENKMFQDLLDESFSGAIAERGSFVIAKTIAQRFEEEQLGRRLTPEPVSLKPVFVPLAPVKESGQDADNKPVT